LRKTWKINGKDTNKTQFEIKKSNSFFVVQQNFTALRKKDKDVSQKDINK